MALETIELALAERLPDRSVSGLIDEAHLRVERYQRSQGRPPGARGFVPCDFVLVWQALQGLVDGPALTGRRFLEWGSGFGVAASLASLLGMESYGIEIDPGLVEEAEALAEDFGAAVEFVCGSLVPAEGAEILDRSTETEWLVPGVADGYDELGMAVDDFDLVFAYPWPGEEGAMEELFDAFAARGAVLLTYHGMEGMRAQRKV